MKIPKYSEFLKILENQHNESKYSVENFESEHGDKFDVRKFKRGNDNMISVKSLTDSTQLAVSEYKMLSATKRGSGKDEIITISTGTPI